MAGTQRTARRTADADRCVNCLLVEYSDRGTGRIVYLNGPECLPQMVAGLQGGRNVHDDDEDDPFAAEDLRVVAERLAAGRLRLRQTIRDLQHGRRTPQQREDIIRRARVLVYRSLLIRRKMLRRTVVH
jgi:hypothetical protein